jgi:hypothetical protein
MDGFRFRAEQQREAMMIVRNLLMVFALACCTSPAMAADPILAERVPLLTRATQWKQVAAIKMQFITHHPQGMAKVGEEFFLSSVHIETPTKRYPQLQDGYDRDTGAGAGHLFKFDKDGKLLADVKLGEGATYHPGGIDYDGRHIWVPVAEYRPNSATIVYRVDPATMKAEEMFRFRDHVGGIVHNTDDRSLHGVSWGSRRFYAWPIDAHGKPTNLDVAPEKLRVLNPALYIDYQDCHYIGGSKMLCSGLNRLPHRARGAPLPPRRHRDRRSEKQSPGLAGSDRNMVAVGIADDAESVLGRADGEWRARLFHAGRQSIDAVRL